MARPVMKPRTVRCGPEWDDALTAAKAKGENLPDVLRAFLKRYARTAPARPDATPPASFVEKLARGTGIFDPSTIAAKPTDTEEPQP